MPSPATSSPPAQSSPPRLSPPRSPPRDRERESWGRPRQPSGAEAGHVAAGLGYVPEGAWHGIPPGQGLVRSDPGQSPGTLARAQLSDAAHRYRARQAAMLAEAAERRERLERREGQAQRREAAVKQKAAASSKAAEEARLAHFKARREEERKIMRRKASERDQAKAKALVVELRKSVRFEIKMALAATVLQVRASASHLLHPTSPYLLHPRTYRASR